MSLILGETRPLARKAHQCNVCWGTIGIGDTYLRQRGIYEGEPVTFKCHLLCDAGYLLAHRELGLWDDEAPDFHESIAPLILAFFGALCLDGRE